MMFRDKYLYVVQLIRIGEFIKKLSTYGCEYLENQKLQGNVITDCSYYQLHFMYIACFFFVSITYCVIAWNIWDNDNQLLIILLCLPFCGMLHQLWCIYGFGIFIFYHEDLIDTEYYIHKIVHRSKFYLVVNEWNRGIYRVILTRGGAEGDITYIPIFHLLTTL